MVRRLNLFEGMLENKSGKTRDNSEKRFKIILEILLKIVKKAVGRYSSR